MTTLPRALRHTLAPDAATARAARHLVEDLVQPVFPPATVERIVLLTSEVVTNALLHARPPYVLDVRLDERAVRVAVHDASPEPPHPRERRLHHARTSDGRRRSPDGGRDEDRVHAARPASDEHLADAGGAVGGWGLVLVREMADAWGSETTPAGKAVWFEIARTPTADG
jgi:hypothetical protein